MFSQYKTKAFVFKKEDRFESDRNFSVFTKDFGRVEILGKSIRKIASKLRGGIELFSVSEIEFVQGKTRKTLTDAVLNKKFKDIYTPEKLEVSYRISEVLDNFIKGQEKDEHILALLEDAFDKLSNYQKLNYQLIYFYFFWNFISLLGYSPELSVCAVCQQKLNPYNLYFSSKEGGIICKNCAVLKRDSIKVKSDIVKVLRLILKKVPKLAEGEPGSRSQSDLGNWGILSKLKIENNTEKSLKEISEQYKNYLLSVNSFVKI